MATPLQRDVFIDTIFEAAQSDRDVLFLSADLGAKALDRFRAELPDQFIHPGICEQNMIDVAAGLARSGKKVITYAMASFITARCYEQIKCALAAMNQPVTVVSVGVGLGYDNAGPTHYTTEDLACLRALPGVEVWSPGDAEATQELARLCLDRPALRYVRLERPALEPLYHGAFPTVRDTGLAEIAHGDRVCILSSGYLLHRALEVRDLLRPEGIDLGVIDLFRLKPLDTKQLANTLRHYKKIVTLEEQCLDGGFGSAVLEALNDSQLHRPLLRLGLPNRFFFENGGRSHVLEKCGLNPATIALRIREFIAGQQLAQPTQTGNTLIANPARAAATPDAH